MSNYIVECESVLQKLSATKDKSVLDAELFVCESGAFTIKIGSIISSYIPLRHPGNTVSLPRKSSQDKRYSYYLKSREVAISEIRKSLG